MCSGGCQGAWGMMGFGWALMLLFWGLLILGIIILVRWFLPRSGGSREGCAVERHDLVLLRERYARGEIGRDEYERIKRDLES